MFNAMKLYPIPLVLFSLALAAQALPESGEAIYQRLCMDCHGKSGEGVAGKYDEAIYGEKSIEALAKYIDKNMPEDEPEKCSAEESQRVAEYIHGAFYSPEARARVQAPKHELTRLTNRQFRESVADLIGSFRPAVAPAEGRGLQGEYFQSEGMNKKKNRAFQRKDERISFDFGEGSPGEGITADQFSIAWEGSFVARESGDYEFRVRTPNGVRVYLNADLQRGDGNFRDDSAAKREPTLIDAWVSSGDTVREETAKVFLLGGRRYPLRIDYFKFKDKRGSVVVECKTPHGVWAVLGGEQLTPTPAVRVALATTSFPADDGSLGYERGTSVSKEWHNATTKAALEIAQEVFGRLAKLSGAKEDDPDRPAKLKAFLATLAERAFRRPLSEELRQLYVERHFKEGLPADVSVKRAVLTILKSPRFLYPELGAGMDDYGTSARLALAMWDSLPDAALLTAASKGELKTREQVRAQAERMMADPRAKQKLAEFFHHWLGMEKAEDLSKDPKAYPGFDAAMAADLRRSMELFVENVVWSEASDYRQLLLADYLYLNPRLAKFYGKPTPTKEEFERVSFDPKERAGIITHPLLLSTFSYHKSSSPIHRGVFLTRNVLGRFLKPPPMAIEFMDDRFDPSLTMREKVTELTNKQSCMGCHQTINPLGFSLEHFDAVGRFRSTDNNKPVNTESDYETDGGQVIRLKGPRDVAEHSVTSNSARQGFVRHLFQFLVKNPATSYGPKTLEELDAQFAANGCHIRKLVSDSATVAALELK